MTITSSINNYGFYLGTNYTDDSDSFSLIFLSEQTNQPPQTYKRPPSLYHTTLVGFLEDKRLINQKLEIIYDQFEDSISHRAVSRMYKRGQ